MNLTLRITGITPLMVHNDRLADPLDEYAKALKALPNKKTEEVIEEMARIEWEGGLVMGPEGPCLRGQQLWKSVVEGARFTKNGRDVERGAQVVVGSMLAPILYDGPRDLEGMWESGRFVDRRTVKVGMQRVARTRPRWDVWACEATFTLLPSVIEPADFLRYATTAGELVGIGDGRTLGYGRYTVERVG